MEAFDVLGEPVRRRLLELIGGGEVAAGVLVEAVRDQFGISQPAVSQHLKVLREHGFVTVRAEGTRRLYSIDTTALVEVDEWLDRFRDLWTPRLDALGTEIARGKRDRRRAAAAAPVADRASTTGPTERARGAAG